MLDIATYSFKKLLLPLFLFLLIGYCFCIESIGFLGKCHKVCCNDVFADDSFPIRVSAVAFRFSRMIHVKLKSG